MPKPQEYSAKERSELLATLSENQGFKLLQAMKVAEYGPIARRVLNGECKDMIQYVKDTAFLKAVNIDEQTIEREVRKHPHGDGSEQSTVVGGDSVNPK